MNKYQWPASKMTSKEMAILCEVRRIYNKPLNECLVDIIHDYAKRYKIEPKENNEDTNKRASKE